MKRFAWRKDRKVLNEAEEAFRLKRNRLYEDWVIFTFGLELGRNLSPEDFKCIYLVFRPPTQFPDAILVNRKTEEVLNVEFEESTNGFRKHIKKHNYRDCDLVVCAEHDWDECPVDVFSLFEGRLFKAQK